MFKSHPKGLLSAALSNMGERFGYYIMNAVLVLFLCSKFGLPEETATAIYSAFYCGIYILSLVGGMIADRTQNYKGTIIWGLIVMTAGYVLLSIPVFGESFDSMTNILVLTCFALFLVAFGNGLFKGNLQALVGQLYDNPQYAAKRDAGFQIFYVFINVGGLIAPFVAPVLRSWWLNVNEMVYNADFPALCHQMLGGVESASENFFAILPTVAPTAEVTVESSAEAIATFCNQYLVIFNEGVHFSFIASIAAMLISLTIFLFTKRVMPSPAKKAAVVVENYTAEERAAMATEIKQRMLALFAVLGVAVFFWWSFHQNGTSMSLFARDFVDTSSIAPEIWQAVNPLFVIVLTPIIMAIFGALAKRGREISTPKKIAYGMGIAMIAYIFMTVICVAYNYPSGTEFRGISEAVKATLKAAPWVLIFYYFFMTVAELFISPLGLSFVSKVAPKHLQGLCQGLWLGATAVGNGLLWVGPLMYNAWPLWEVWAVFAAVCALSMGTMLAMVTWLERVTR